MSVEATHIRGLVISALGVLVITPDSLLIRLIDTDPWTILFFRGSFLGLTLICFYAIRFGTTAVTLFLAVGRAGILASFLAAASNILFVISITLTTVANTLVIVSAAPLFAAIYSRIFLKEVIATRTWIAVILVFFGIGTIFSGSLGGGNLVGDFCAIGAALFFSGHLTVVRYAKNVSMVPAVALSGLFAALLSIPLANPFSISMHDLYLLAVMGFVMLPVALALIVSGPRLIPAPEVGLLILLESVLGPLWVWIFIREIPTVQTLLGGIIIIGTLAIHTTLLLVDDRIKAN